MNPLAKPRGTSRRVDAGTMQAFIRWKAVTLLALLMAWHAQVVVASAGQDNPDRAVIATGGGTSRSGEATVTGTIGQPAANAMIGPGVTIQGGFWSFEGVPLSAAGENPSENPPAGSDWSLAWEANGGRASAGQTESGGNPGAYRSVTNYSVGDEVRSFSILLTAGYNPATQGALLGTDFQLEVLLANTAGVQVGPALVQDGTYYFAATPALSAIGGWQPFAWTNLVAGDFRTSASAMDHPDFTLKGSRIHFGYSFYSPSGAAAAEFTLGVDNFSAHPNPAPPPSYVIWTNTAGGSWSTTANWNPRRLPGTNDIAVIAAPGTYTVTIDQGASCSVLLLGGAPGTQSLDWFNGGFRGNLYIEPNAILTLTGSTPSLAGTIKNRGRILWPRGKTISWRYEEGARLKNEPDGLLEILGQGAFYWMGTEPRLLHNAGTLRIDCGPGKIAVYAKIQVLNEGTIQVDSGTLTLHNLDSRGAIAVAAGAQMELNGGLVRLEPGHRFEGSGTWWLSGDNTIQGPLSAPSVFTVSANARFDSELNASMWWTNGTLLGDLTIGRNGVFNLLAQSGGSLSMKGVVTNYGEVNWTGNRNNWYWYAGALLENQREGLMTFDFDAILGIPAECYLHNHGTLRKTGGTGTASFRGGTTYWNDGLLDVQSGTLEFAQGVQNNGEIHLATGCELSLIGGECNFGTGSIFTGDGVCSFGGSTVRLLGSLTGSVLFKMVYGTYFDAGLEGALLWQAGNLTGRLTVGPSGSIQLAAPGSLNGKLINLGTILWPTAPPASWRWESGSTLENQAAGIVEIQADHSLYAGSTGISFTNAGVFRKTGGTASTTIPTGIDFYNSGTVEILSGSVRFNGKYEATADARLSMLLGGETPGTEYSSGLFGKPLALAGTLAIQWADGYLPRLGARFDVLKYPAFSGGFAALEGVELPGGLQILSQFTPSTLSLLVTNAPVPPISATLVPGALRITLPTEQPGWRLYSTTNLLQPDWKLVPLPEARSIDLMTEHPEGYFRLGTP